MMIQGVSVGEMVNQSINVLTKPSIATFEQYERRGGQREGLIYMGIAVAISAVASLIGGLLNPLFGPVYGLINGLISPMIGYFVFSYIVFALGKNQGGTGTQDEVFYTFALFTAPLQAIGGIIGGLVLMLPLLGCLALPISLGLLGYQAYLAYLASRSSMNLDQNKAIITIVVAFFGTVIAGGIFGAILGSIFNIGAIDIPTPPTP